MAGSPEQYRPIKPGGIDFRGEPQIDKKERPTLACTKEAVSGLDLAFDAQVKTQLWPRNVSDKALNEAAKVNREINSHYTIVRVRDGELMTEPYHVVFSEQLSLVAFWLEGAAQETKNHRFGDYLRELVNELRFGEAYHERVVKAWLSMKEESYVDFIGGAIDRYRDRRGIKFYFQGATGTLDRNATNDMQEFTNVQLAVWRDIAPPYAPKNSKVRVRVDNTERFGGLAREMKPSANNLPCEPELRERYGSKIVYFLPSLLNRLLNEKLQYLASIIPSDVRKGWTEDDLIEAGLLVMGAHEPGHSLIRRANDEERFGSTFAYVNEKYATVLGLAIVGMRDDISDETKNRILAVQFATFADAYAQREIDPSRKVYLDGFSTIFDQLLEAGVVVVDNEGRIRWSDHRPVYKKFRELQMSDENFTSYSNANMASRLRQKHGHLKNLQLLRPFREKRITDSEDPPDFLKKRSPESESNGKSVGFVPGS